MMLEIKRKREIGKSEFREASLTTAHISDSASLSTHDSFNWK